MRLPVILPPLKPQRFSCRSCTTCCRDLVVHLTRRDREKIDEQGWRDKLDRPPCVPLGRSDVLNHRPGGGCVFLMDDGRCRIHAEFGASAKPLACQLYPFTLEREGDVLRAGIRFDCPSVARNEGMPIGAHAKDVGRLAEELREARAGALDAAAGLSFLKPTRRLAPVELNGLIDGLDGWLCNVRYSLADRLIGLEDFASTMQRADLGQVREDRFVELARMLVGDLPNVVQACHESPPGPPAARQLRLFRQTIFSHCEHISLEQAQSGIIESLRYRFRQLHRARRMSAARGETPQRVPGVCGVPFERIEAVRLHDDAEPPAQAEATNELATRYLRARLLGRSAFGSGYYGWPVLTGLSALLLAAAAAGWLARYFAAATDRDVVHRDDMVRAIGIVDRAAGRARELGSRTAALRLVYLARDRGLSRLVVRYLGA